MTLQSLARGMAHSTWSILFGAQQPAQQQLVSSLRQRTHRQFYSSTNRALASVTTHASPAADLRQHPASSTASDTTGRQQDGALAADCDGDGLGDASFSSYRSTSPLPRPRQSPVTRSRLGSPTGGRRTGPPLPTPVAKSATRPSVFKEFFKYSHVEGDAEVADARMDVLREREMQRDARELLIQCTILDREGNTESVSGTFHKVELCSMNGLQPRDLRKVDSRIPNVVPTILVRKESILVNMLHVRALIKADSVVLFETGGWQSRLLSDFLRLLQRNLREGHGVSGALPYEFRALDSILSSATSALEAEMVNLRVLVGQVLDDLEAQVDRDKLKLLLQYSRKLAGFAQRARLVQDCLEEVLEQDEDLASMYLSEKVLNRRPRMPDDHEEIELLLESYSKQVEEIVNEADNLVANVKSTEEIVELILDNNRNQLLALDLKISIMTMGLGSGAVVAGLFGMNLSTQLETHPYAFFIVTGSAGFISLLVTAFGLRKLRLLRRVGLGSGGGAGKKYEERAASMMRELAAPEGHSHWASDRGGWGDRWGAAGRVYARKQHQWAQQQQQMLHHHQLQHHFQPAQYGGGQESLYEERQGQDRQRRVLSRRRLAGGGA